MNEYNLHRVLALLADAAGLTQPQQFAHAYAGCMGQVNDLGAHWECGSCRQRLPKQLGPGQAYGVYETNKQPSNQAMTFIQAQLGPPGMTYPQPIPVIPPVSEEQIRHALGIDKDTLDKFVEEITRPAPRSAIEEVDQEIGKYTGRV